MGACCKLTLLAHEMSYNFSVKPCESPSVQIEFNVTDIEGMSNYIGKWSRICSVLLLAVSNFVK